MTDIVIEELIKRVTNLEESLNNAQSQRALFPIYNVNAPPEITANQNDYDPGNYGALRLSSDQDGRRITGIAGGYKGRILILVNSAGNTIILNHLDAASAVGNRIRIPGAGNLTMQPNGNGNATSVMLLYGGSSDNLWNLLYKSAP